MIRSLRGSLFVAALMSATLFAEESDKANPTIEVVIGNFLPDESAARNTGESPLKSPFGVDFDADNNMVIVELEGGRVHRYSSDRKFETIAGNGMAGYEGDGQSAKQAVFNGMHNVAVTQGGDIYISDTWNHCVRKIAGKSGIITTIAGTGEAGFEGDNGPATEAKFDYVMCVTLSPDERQLYLADTNNRRIRMVDLETGVVTTVAGNGEKGVPEDGSDPLASPLIDPRAVAVDSKNQVYILERSGNALRVVKGTGDKRTLVTVAGTGEAGHRDGNGRAAEFSSPKHLCVDKADNVYVADEANHLIRKYDPKSGDVTTILGNKIGTPPVSLSHPHGVCIHAGMLYVVDSSNNRVLRVAGQFGN